MVVDLINIAQVSKLSVALFQATKLFFKLHSKSGSGKSVMKYFHLGPAIVLTDYYTFKFWLGQTFRR